MKNSCLPGMGVKDLISVFWNAQFDSENAHNNMESVYTISIHDDEWKIQMKGRDSMLYGKTHLKIL